MLILVARYTFLIWLLINPLNPKDPQQMRLDQMAEEDPNIYRIGACTARCLQQFPQQQKIQPDQQFRRSHFENCIAVCKNASTTSSAESSPTKKHIRKIQENFSLNPICRDERSLTFRINLEGSAATASSIKRNLTNSTTTDMVENQVKAATLMIAQNAVAKDQLVDTLFIIKINVAKGAVDYDVYMSDENFLTIRQLQPNTTYNINVMAIHANSEYSVIAKDQQYATMHRGFTPGMVKNIHVRSFNVDEMNEKRLSAKIAWTPSSDMTCSYNIICFAPESEEFDMTPLEIRNPRQLYTYNLENLTFSLTYKVGIRSKNPNNMSKESDLYWETFKAPSCLDWYNYNFSVCAPLEPNGLDVEQIFRGDNEFSLNITWQLPQHFPDYYTARILDLSAFGISAETNISKELTSLYISKIILIGVLFEVQLTAFTPGGSSTAVLKTLTQQHHIVSDKNHIVKLISALLALVFCIAILSLTIFIICHRRAKLKRYQERCKYFEELEKKAPIDPKATFDFPTKSLPTLLSAPEEIFFIDAMEIDRSDITLYEVLGEGAFGLVRRGIFRDEKLGSREVAVKMLKDQPSPDDVRAFRREIEVMKSVERHTNIVGIIGHCTKHYNEMMLLTEYCSLGNLLDFLRDEWKYLHKLNTKSNAGNVAGRHPRLPSRSRSANSNSNNNRRRHRQHSNSTNQRNNSCATMHKQRQHYHNNNNNNNNNNNGSSNKNNNNNKSSNVFNIDGTLIEKFKLKYITLNTIGLQQQQQQQPSTKNYNQAKTTPMPIEDVTASGTTTRTPTTSNSTTSTLTATDNKSYGYDEICTNSCKCQVDIVFADNDESHTDADDIRDIDPSASHELHQFERMLQQQQEQPTTPPPPPPLPSLAKTIEIKNCECKQLRQQMLLAANNKKNVAVDNKTYFDATNANNIIDHHKSRANVDDDDDNDDVLLLPSSLHRVPLSAGDLLDIARQVAVGMEFLAKNKVVHRDLAARNVLVAPDRTIKIADFGLSRDIYQENIYKKTGNGKLPIKWLALESMTHQVYTTQSDVWSYGILLYEIVTLGGTPYPSIPTKRLLHLLKSGYRMDKPCGCGQKFYDLMYSCWNVNPAERPNFTDIILQLDNLMCESPMLEQIENIGECVQQPLQVSTAATAEATSDDPYLKPL